MPRPRRTSTISSVRSSVPGSRASGPGEQELSALYDYLLKVILTGPSAVGKSSLLYRLANPISQDPTSTPSSLPTSPIPAAHPTQKASASDLPYLPQTIGIDLHTHLLTLGGSPTAHHTATPPKPSTLSASYLAKRKSTHQPTAPPPRQTKIKLQLWDTAGTERFRAVGRAYYRASCAALVVYDVGSRASLRACEAFVRDIRVLAGEACMLVLVGNKVDVDDVDSASSADGQAVREVSPEEADAFATRHGISLAVEVSARTGLGVEQLFRRVASVVLAQVEMGEIDPGDVSSGVHYGDMEAWASGDDDGRTGSRAGGAGLQMWGSAFGARRLGEQRRGGCC